MPALTMPKAIERLVEGVGQVRPDDLPEIHAEIFPETAPPPHLGASDIIGLIRGGLEPEQVVDLWNVIFPRDRNVWYDEESGSLRFNDEVSGYLDEVEQPSDIYLG